MKKRYNYRLGGGARVGEPYLLVTRYPFPEVFWQVPYPDMIFWVRQRLDMTEWEEPEQFAALVGDLKQFEV